VSILELDPTYLLHDPPELTRPMAAARWRELNMLIHSISLLADENTGRGPLLPMLRASATLAGADRALLYRWDDVTGGLRLTAAHGFEDAHAERLYTHNEPARASLLHRKPVILSDPDEAWLADEMCRLGSRSALSVPVSCEGMPWGALQFLRGRPYVREEAVLVWMFVMMVEGMLPLLMASARHSDRNATVDAATGLLMPSHFRRRLSWEVQRAEWMARPLTVLCVEITEMLHGRPRGGSLPFTLQAAAAVVQKTLRSHDAVTCLGGHHFVAALPDTAAAEAQRASGLIREGLLDCSAGTLPVFDIQMGSATFPEDGRTESDLIRAACASGRQSRGRISRNPPAG
jgi:GGDEF domain-containing protein